MMPTTFRRLALVSLACCSIGLALRPPRFFVVLDIATIAFDLLALAFLYVTRRR